MKKKGSQSLLHQVQVWNIPALITRSKRYPQILVSIPSSSGLGLELSPAMVRNVIKAVRLRLNPFFIRSRFGTRLIMGKYSSDVIQVSIPSSSGLGLELRTDYQVGADSNLKSQSLLHQVQVWNIYTKVTMERLKSAMSQSLLHQVQVWNRCHFFIKKIRGLFRHFP